jgi:hypothetical protein
MRIRSLPLTGWEKTAPKGSVNPISHLMDSSSRIRVTNAKPRPMVRALTRWVGGSFPARIEIKITLSIPRTISRKVNVTRLTQVFGSPTQLIHSIEGDRT